MNYDYGLTPEQSRCLARERDEARAEVERLREQMNQTQWDTIATEQAHRAALESLRERCAAALDGHDGHYGLSGSAARRIVRAVPLKAP